MTAPHRQLLLAIFALALAVRLAHNEIMVTDPLYVVPLGGNLPLLVMAEEIAEGDLLPQKGPFTENSPLYPYLVAGIYAFTSVNDLHAVRVVSSIADALTCTIAAWLALGFLGTLGAAVTGVGLALNGPLIFFATQLVPVSFMLLLVSGALVLLELARRSASGSAAALPSSRMRALRPWGGAGLLLGLAAGLHPDLLLTGVLALALPFLWKARPTPLASAGALAAGLALGIAPVTVMNGIASHRFVLLTVAAGHNFYIGHNPLATPQYTFPFSLEKHNTFDDMRALAEKAENRPIAAEDVSGYYVRKALTHIRQHPGREAELLAERTLAVVNDFEATTYSDFYYQREISPLLRWTFSFGWIFPLALLGMIASFSRERAHLWIPFVSAVATVLTFFYISRLRAVMLPSIGIFLGAGAVALREAVRSRRTRTWSLAGAVAVVALGALVANRPFLAVDTSNEWNKAGGLLRLQNRFPEAEAAFRRALEANPSSANAHLNLAVLYRQTGRAAEAARMDSIAADLLARERDVGEAYRRALERTGG